MSNREPEHWHQKTFFRVLLLLLLPLIVGGLYIISARITLKKAPSSELNPENSLQEYK